MMRNRFDEQLDLLKKEMINMGAMCEDAIRDSIKALVDGDIEKANLAIASDSDIDRKERDIEALCLKLLLQQQPVAKDLRQISAALKMITDMERIGDQAADIAEITKFIKGSPYITYTKIDEMADVISKMVTSAVDAYVMSDIALAKKVEEKDDIVDNIFTDMKTELIGLIAERPDQGELALDLLMIAKYFERIGDHATNIAEWVEFSVTGAHKGDNE